MYINTVNKTSTSFEKFNTGCDYFNAISTCTSSCGILNMWINKRKIKIPIILFKLDLDKLDKIHIIWLYYYYHYNNYIQLKFAQINF